MRSLIYAALLMGFALLAISNVAMRTKEAPPLGSGPFRWPWQVRSWFTAPGYWVQLFGWVFWVTAGLGSGFLLFSLQ